MYTPKIGGWVQDRLMPGQHDDYSFTKSASSIAAMGSTVADPVIENSGVVDLRKWCSPIEDQGHLSSCVANAIASSLELLKIRDGQPHEDLSRLFIYYNSRLMHGDANKDAGTFIRLAMGTLSSLGTCLESRWPYDLPAVNVRPTWGSYRDAYANKIGAFYSIQSEGDQRIDEIKTALQSQHPVVFGMLINDDFMKCRGGIVPLPQPGSHSLGGHAMLIVGYDDTQRVLIVRNSWGTWWGDSGYCLVPYAYLDIAEANDFWVPTAAP